ncbi:MAG: CIA30 family protein [Balneolaceae bacterium]
MRMILFLILFFIQPVDGRLFAQELLIDFGRNTGGQTWSVTNDGVMGGLSQGQAYLSDSSVVFQGEVSLENNGGFSSLRSPYQRFNLSDFEEVEIKTRSSGLSFSITFSKSQRFWIPNYKHFLGTNNDEWVVSNFKLSELEEYRMGNSTNKSISSRDIGNLIGISFFNEGKKEGPFVLEVDYILFK